MPVVAPTQMEMQRNLQVTAQVPMLVPAVTLSRSGRFPNPYI